MADIKPKTDRVKPEEEGTRGAIPAFPVVEGLGRAKESCRADPRGAKVNISVPRLNIRLKSSVEFKRSRAPLEIRALRPAVSAITGFSHLRERETRKTKACPELP